MKVVERDIGTIFGEEEIEAIRAVLAAGKSLSWGPELEAFEKDFREYCGAKHAVAVSSCTGALQIAAQILRLGPADEIVSTPQSFWSTLLFPAARGVRVRFADIDPQTVNLDPETIEVQITPRTKAIYIVHHGGNPADLDPIRAVAKEHKVELLEDCAHATGAEYKGRKIGDGELCCFSFQSLKNMSTLGEGGMLTTNNAQWAAKAAHLRTMGVLGRAVDRGTDRIGPYAKPDFPLLDHAQIAWTQDWAAIEEFGTHFRLSAVQAAVGRVQLRKLDGLCAKRAEVARRYNEAVVRIGGLRAVRVRPGDKCAWHLYTCFVEPDSGVDRNVLLRYMQEVHGIQMILRYWPLHLNAALRAAGHRFGECPVCEKVWFEQQVNLHISPTMEDWEIDAVIEALSDGMKKCRR